LGVRPSALEDLVTGPDFWRGRRVFLTGHTGFKGSWLSLWLSDLGADITGYSLAPPTDPSLFESARVGQLVRHIEADVRDLDRLHAAMREARPEVVFHLAAQPLVRLSYDEPVETFATNVMGTVNVLEAVRRTGGVRSAVIVTTDKCYENQEHGRPFGETDPMGGHDPYSSSKGCAELVVSAYRRSFFDPALLADHGTGVASGRAGNVIGGGDWADNRLVPDIVRALLSKQRPVIRYPDSIRPWQHVLEPLRGYIMLAERLHAGEGAFAEGWNFGPAQADAMPVSAIADQLTGLWGNAGGWERTDAPQRHEAGALRLDVSKADRVLGWRPALPLSEALSLVMDWHRRTDAGEDARSATIDQIRAYRRLVSERAVEAAA
jgi:CDP-glucose 4,6-dehydratase